MPLVVLAAGAMLLWLAVGFYSSKALAGMEIYNLHERTLSQLWHETLASPLLIVTGVIVLLWVVLYISWTKSGKALSAEGAWADALTETKFGFDAFYQTGVRMLTEFCQGLRTWQSGDINYNAAAVAVGLLILLLLLAPI